MLHTRRPHAYGYAGLVLTVVGVAAAVVAAFTDHGWEPLPAACIVLGVMLMLYCCGIGKLDAVNRPADEAFESGYEIGHDKGWRDCEKHSRPVVVRLEGNRDGMGREAP